jgi:hypothetical protein
MVKITGGTNQAKMIWYGKIGWHPSFATYLDTRAHDIAHSNFIFVLFVATHMSLRWWNGWLFKELMISNNCFRSFWTIWVIWTVVASTYNHITRFLVSNRCCTITIEKGKQVKRDYKKYWEITKKEVDIEVLRNKLSYLPTDLKINWIIQKHIQTS